MGLPSSWMVPETRCAFPLALMRLASTLRSDVLPAPLGPMIAQVLPPPREPEMPLRISFSLALVPTPYLTSAQEKVESITGATWTRCTSVACCFSAISWVALDISSDGGRTTASKPNFEGEAPLADDPHRTMEAGQHAKTRGRS